MFIPSNSKVMLILMLALSLACACMSKAASTNTPQIANTCPTKTGHYDKFSLYTGAATRDGWVYIPAAYSSYSSAGPVPLIVNFHGKGSNGCAEAVGTGMSAFADYAGFLVAYPNANGTNREWITDPGPAGAADRQFVRDLVNKLQGVYNVDKSRIFATGMSNGSGMAYRAGCDLADIFAAIAPVEGGYAEPGWINCFPTRSVPVMAFHGITDPVVPYWGGPGTGPATNVTFPRIPDWATAWAMRDSCNTTPMVTTTQSNTFTVTRQEWLQCKDGATVILFSINPHGHAWPKGDPIDATTEMWKFFLAHPKP